MKIAQLGKVQKRISCSNPYGFVIGEIYLKCGSHKYSGTDKVRGHTKVSPKTSNTPTM